MELPDEWFAEHSGQRQVLALEPVEKLYAAASQALALLNRVPPSGGDEVPVETVRANLRAALGPA
jgi:hypothetical protein